MKALVVTPYYYPKIGGLENYARQLGLSLRSQAGWDIAVATSNHESRGDRIDEADGMAVYRLGAWFKFSNTPVNPLWAFKLRRIIKHERPDIILAHTPVPTMADAAALARGRTPLVLFYHAATLEKGGSRLFNIVAKAYQIYEKLTLSRATRIAAPSDYVKASLPSRFQAKSAVVPNSVWHSDIVARKQPEDSPAFVFIGSLDRTHAWKGVDLILQSIAEYKAKFGVEATLTIIGDGNYRTHYQAKAAELGIEKLVRFTGALVGRAKDKELAKATALICYPTTSNDAFPTVILEAWALGVPVVAAAIGPVTSTINDGRDGFLAKPHSPSALAGTMHAVATMPSEGRALVADAAASRTRSLYTWELQATAVSQIADGIGNTMPLEEAR